MKLFKWGIELFNGHQKGGHTQWLSRLLRLGKIICYINPVHRYGKQSFFRDGQNYMIHIGRITIQWVGPSFYYVRDKDLTLYYPPWSASEINSIDYFQDELYEDGYHFFCDTCMQRLVATKQGWRCPKGCNPPEVSYVWRGISDIENIKGLFLSFHFIIGMYDSRPFFWWWGTKVDDIETRIRLYIHDKFPELIPYLRREWQLMWVRYYGFNPLGITYFSNGEPSILFRTEEEAARAFEVLEKDKGKVYGFWVTPEESKEEFNRIIDVEDEDFNDHVHYCYENLTL